MPFDFDTPVERRCSDSIKWGKYAGTDIIPLWVADMDFMSPPAVMEALHKRVEHGVFGYGSASADLVETVVKTMDREFQWQVDPQWLVWLPGLVCGLNVTCSAVGEPGDSVLVQTPVYPPFLTAPELMGRKLETAPLQYDGKKWTFSKRRLAAAVTPTTRLMLLCHPHNPIGRVWGEDELQQIADVCLEKRLIICSDEIHNQLILEPGLRHRPLATVAPEIASRTVTLLAPSKTFNIPGLGCSLAIIPDADLRRRFTRAAAGIVPHVNLMGLVAAQAAWSEGGPWLAELLDYLRGNRDYLVQQIDNIPEISMSKVEATCLAWLDVSKLGQSKPAEYFEQFGIGLSDGREFAGPQYVRLNFGCSRETLVEACLRLVKGVEALR